jgi:hypothetical protein
MTDTQCATAVWAMLFLCACTPDARNASGALRPVPSGSPNPSATVGVTTAPLPTEEAASYEVSIASAQADRVRARDQCDSQPMAARKACRAAADGAYDRAKSAADSADNRAH